MKKRTKAIVLISLLFLALVLLFPFIEAGLSCLAYYEQCTAVSLEGLTKEQCFKREDTVAFLFEGDICLVKPSE
ncbi:hypothetical protein [Endozoicomonas atrinae]|uniref:hypothetical protein n=1 Tax=Endozoicomonas atrinae TaxID=1333660 RepID=UPI001112FD41|nr:hypothetical protein [Endozoicomonas atrinae]